MKFNENLKYLRKQEGLTQEQLAEKLSVSRQAITKWEAGQALPDISNIIEISNIFGVTLDELLKDEKVSKNTTLNKKLKDLPLILFVFAFNISFFIIDVGIKNVELVIAIFMLSILLVGFKLKRYITGREIIDLTDSEKGKKERRNIIARKSLLAELYFLIYIGIVYISRRLQGLEIFDNSMDLLIGSFVALIVFPILLTIDMKSKIKEYNKNND